MTAESTSVDVGLGDRVQIEVRRDGGPSFGVVKYYGDVKGASGTWIGIELDDPVGR